MGGGRGGCVVYHNETFIIRVYEEVIVYLFCRGGKDFPQEWGASAAFSVRAVKRSIRKESGVLAGGRGIVYDLPAPINLSLVWNFGSLLGIGIMVQIVSGILLARHYSPCAELAFESVCHIVRDGYVGDTFVLLCG